MTEQNADEDPAPMLPRQRKDKRSERPPGTSGRNAAIAHFAVLVAVILAVWAIECEIRKQTGRTDGIIVRTGELSDQIKSTQQSNRKAEESVNALLSTLTERLGSIEDQLASARDQLHLLKQSASDHRATIAISHARALQVKSLVEEARQTIGDYRRDLQTYNALLERTRNRTEPDAESFSTEELTLLDYHFSEVTTDRTDNWSQRLTTLMTPVDDILTADKQGIDIPDTTLTEVSELAATIQQRHDDLKSKLESLQAFTRRFAAPEPKRARSLQDLVAEHRLAKAARHNETLVTRVASEQEQTDQAVEDAVADSLRKLRDVRIVGEQLLGSLQADAAEQEHAIQGQLSREQTAARKREAEQKQRDAELLAEQQKQQREYEAALPEMRRLLVPFLSSGHKQLNGTAWAEAAKPVPLSYAGIRASGALESSSTGQQAFLWLAGGPYNDRPDGIFPQYIGGDVSFSPALPSIRRGQSLLNEFGELLVANGLLAP
ncbi:hypothetical protein GC176_27570 [bacterium]|nr:hypothetical protein [bacterium]